MEVPGKCMPCATPSDESDVIDLSFAREYIEEVMINIPKKNEISPTLRHIVRLFDEKNQRPLDTIFDGQKEMEEVDAAGENQADSDGDASESCGACSFDHDDQSSVVDGSSNFTDPIFPSHQEENDSYAPREPDTDENFEKVVDYLFLGLGVSSNQNAWAGPDHWKFRKAKGSEDTPVTENGSLVTTKKPKKKKLAASDIDYTEFLDKEMPNIFAPPKNPKSLLQPANRVPCNNRLPQDCHYQPEDLVKLFLLLNTMCLGKRARKPLDESRCQGPDFRPLPSWDEGSVFNDQFDDGNFHSDGDYSNTLVSQPHQMSKLESELERRAVTYTLWNQSTRKTEMTWHPVTFGYADSGPQQIKVIKDMNDIYYETEYQTE